MKIYILRADGPLAKLDGRLTYVHHKAFRTKPAAEAGKPAFRHACITLRDDYDLAVLVDDDQLKIRVLELDLQNGDTGC